MAEVGKILRALVELKRKAEGNFCEIKSKISRLESKFTMMSMEQDNLKKEIQLSRTKQMIVQPVEGRAAARRGRRKATRRRRKGRAAACRGRRAAAGRVVRAAAAKVTRRRPTTGKRA